MSKNCRFRGPLDKQHGKPPQARLKSPSQHLYDIHWVLLSQLRLKRSLLFTSKILVLFVNTLAPNGRYPVLNRDNLVIPIQMQLFQKQKKISGFLTAFLKFGFNFKYFQKKKKMSLIDFAFSKLRTQKGESYQCLKGAVFENLSTSNMLNEAKHCWNLHHKIFIIFIDQCQVNWVGKNLSY